MRKSKLTEYNYEDDLRIDPNALDIEFLDQPSQFMKYAALAAKARKRVDGLKEELDVVRAKADSRVRADPEKYGIAKLTETTVSGAVVQHPKYEEANHEYLEAKYEYELLQAAVRAFDQRKVALENLVRLLGMEYFSAPREPRDLGKEYLENGAHAKASDKVLGKLKKGKDD